MTVDKTTRNRQNAPSRARYEAKAYRKYTIRVRQDAAGGFTPDELDAAAAAVAQPWHNTFFRKWPISKN